MLVLPPQVLLASRVGFIPAIQSSRFCPGQRQLCTPKQPGRQPKPVAALMSQLPLASEWWPLEENLVARGGGSPLHLFEGSEGYPFPEWVPSFGSLCVEGSGSPIYTFVSQFGPDQEPGLFSEGANRVGAASPSSSAAADVAFLRGLDVDGLTASKAACDEPVRRFMVSPATATPGGSNEGRHPPYDDSYLPTPATLIADLKATASFCSDITDLDNDGSRGPLPFVKPSEWGMDEMHEDANQQSIFSTPEELAEEELEEEQFPGIDCREFHPRSIAVHAALKQYVLNQRVFFVVVHTGRWVDEELPEYPMSTHELVMALGVSGAAGNLVGVMAIQTDD
ncbi:unnamed protein product [Ectocarpus fasciculatus]